MRKHLKNKLVLSILLVLLITSFSKAQEIKAPIAQALNTGDTTLAINLLNKEISVDKTYYINYFMLGKIAFERMDFVEAENQFHASLKAKKKHYESLYLLGMTQLKLEKLELALESFKKGKKKDKKNKARFNDGLGLVAMEQERYQDADKFFRLALVEEPDNATYHIHLGDANFYQGVPSLAVLEYELALEVDTAGLEVYYHWAEACIEMKDYTCAIDKLSIVLQKDSTHAPSWRRAAGIYFKAARSSRSREERTTRFKETIGAYKKYIEISNAEVDSAHVRVYFELAMSYSALYGFEDAVEYYDKVLNIPFVAKDIYFNYAKALWGVKQYEKSGENLLKHVEWVEQQDEEYKSSIKNYELNQLLGDSYYYRSSKDYMTAIGYYIKSLEDRPKQKRLVQNVAVGYNNLKSYAQALEYYEKRIEFGVNEKSVFLYKYAGNCALALANNSGDEEEDIDEEEGEEEPAEVVDPVALYTIALGHYSNYLEYKPDDTATVLIMASTYLHQLEDCTNGVKYYEMVLKLDPNNCDASKYLGYGYLTGEVCSKSYTKAIKYLKIAQVCITAKGSGCDDIGLTLGIAQSYHLRGADKLEKGGDATEDNKAAYKWYKKVLKCEPGHKIAKEGRDALEFEI